MCGGPLSAVFGGAVGVIFHLYSPAADFTPVLASRSQTLQKKKNDHKMTVKGDAGAVPLRKTGATLTAWCHVVLVCFQTKQTEMKTRTCASNS